ncbi:helix-turn-helix domain-containing protein [Enterobacteriaceae bacterium H16N7]|nr:helix-turn-helix domain-containing protein [Dryocola clanedunensis]
MNPTPTRPEASINRLLTILTPLGRTVEAVARKKLGWHINGQPVIYAHLKGELSVSRVADGILVATVLEPHIFGIAEVMQPLKAYQLRAETQSVLSRIDGDVALKAIEKYGLWRDVAEVLSFHTNSMAYRDMQIVNRNTYQIIRYYLMELEQLPEEIRMRVSILSYIQERTGLSRSSILNTISSLKKDKHIVFARGGYLLELHNLPDAR